MSSKASFLPEDYLDRRLAKRSHMVFITLFAIVLLTAVGGFVVLLSQQRAAREAYDQVARRIQVESKQLETIKKLESQREAMLRKASVTATLKDPIQKSNILAELINHMPLTLSLTDMKISTEVIETQVVVRTALAQAKQRKQAEKEAETPPPPPERVVGLRVVGLAPSDLDVSTFMVSLQAHPLFREVELLQTRLQRVDDLVMREFQMQLTLDPTMTMADLEPTRRDRGLNVNPISGTVIIEPTSAP